VISRTGRYRQFPIIGTAISFVGFVLLSRLGVGTPAWVPSVDMLVLGVGIGMTMQVLILAVQNSVPQRVMGVATSGAMLFRQVGGSIGVALFGAIFANRLHAGLADQLPGLSVGRTPDPATIKRLPPAQHSAFVSIFSDSLQPVFVVGAVLIVVAFGLTWLLREVPLRKSVGAGETAGEAFGLEEAA
jgi:hypothetical protein